MSELIPYANAHVNQHTNKGVKGLWQIEENVTNRNLGSLPPYFNSDEVFGILDIIRKAELNAFNVGIEFGKSKSDKLHSNARTQLKANIGRLRNENLRLANVLDEMTRSK